MSIKRQNNIIKTAIAEGMRDGIPIGLGYLAVAFSLGIVARSAGLTPVEGFFASLFTAASAGEYAVFAMMIAQASYMEVFMITLVANLRYLLMSCALAQRFDPKESMLQRLGVGAYVTDEIFGITIARPGKVMPFYTYGAILIAIPAWGLGTALGIAAGNMLPVNVVSALSVALYGMFIAIIIPPAKKDKVVCAGVAAGFLLSYLCSVLPVVSELSDGTRTIILTIVISAAAAFFFPHVETETEKGEEAEHAQ